MLAVHLVGGLFGSIALGLFADSAINEVVTNPGVFMTGGGTDLLVDQIVASVAVFVFSFVVTFAIGKVIDLVVGLRVDSETEDIGLDQVLHAETSYSL